MRDVLSRAGTFAVNILSMSQEAISRRFGLSEPDLGGIAEEERFVGVGYARGSDGAALLEDCLAYLECRIVDRHDAGDHMIVIGEVQTAVAHEERPLLYYRGGYAGLER
jgi:flavin reductase (DIM6/NTAB) family NADH-FMN oxidoreductase RutF